ncbi:MAG: ATP-binding protein [Pseudomonadota bacterium]
MQESLFQPFITTKKGGQGLGLALVAKLVSEMSGDIQIRRVDGCTHVIIQLPLQRS